MKRCVLILCGLAALFPGRDAPARPGTITWSDGRKVSGDLTLTTGKQLQLFTAGLPVELPLEECRQLRFTPEKEKMQEGFYFPTAGQATQAKTGDIYPVRYLRTQITLPDGKVLDGHLFTTVLYIQNDSGAQKAVLESKQTGTDGQTLRDVPYVSAIDFADAAGGESKLDLSREKVPDAQTPVVILKPDLSPVSLEAGAAPGTWSLPAPDPSRMFLSIQGSDGFHVAWPSVDAAPEIIAAVQTGLRNMHDFYDTRALLGTIAEDDSVYSLVLLSRAGTTYSMNAGTIPWSLVVLHWKYDSGANTVNLVNRASLGMGRTSAGGPLPPILKNAALLNDIRTSAAPAASPSSTP